MSVLSKLKLSTAILGSLLIFASVVGPVETAQAAITLGANSVSSDGAYTLDHGAATAMLLGPSATSGTMTIGGASQTGTLTIGRSTAGQTINIGTAAGVNSINIGNTTGASSITIDAGTGNINIGQSVHARTWRIGDAAAAQTMYIGDNDASINLLRIGGTTSKVTIGGTFTVMGNGPNYIATENGANNAIAGFVQDSVGTNIPLTAGLIVYIKLGHTLQAGANTFTLNAGVAKNIKSHFNAANDIATGYAATGIIGLMYDGTQWLDLSQ